jgi:hypothetical protein
MTADPTTNLKILIYKLFHSLEPEMQRLFADEIEKYIGAERHPCADGCLALKLLKQIEVPRGQFQNQ